jgi:hypothetical protein
MRSILYVWLDVGLISQNQSHHHHNENNALHGVWQNTPFTPFNVNATSRNLLLMEETDVKADRTWEAS